MSEFIKQHQHKKSTIFNAQFFSEKVADLKHFLDEQ